MQWSPRVRLATLALSVAIGFGACTGSSTDEPMDQGSAADRSARAELDQVDALGCDQESIGEQDGAVVAALALDDGEVAGWCFGAPDARLEDAYVELVAITPASDLADIDLVAGFEQPDGDTLAFAAMIGDRNDSFVVAINLPLAEDDPEELRLTLAHEVAHVFTQTPDQLDVEIDEADCDTFFNGNGCLLDDAYLTRWIEDFWSPEQLASLPDPTATDEEGGNDRCSLDPAFLGAYAASHPEEDFAESFGAFVFDLDVAPGVQPKLDFFDQFPELVAFRTKVENDGLPTPPNNFDECG